MKRTIEESAAPPETAINPIDGESHKVKVLLQHPQLASSGCYVVQCEDTGMQWTDPLPTPEELSRIYAEDYNAKYGRDLSENAKIPPFVTRRAVAQRSFMETCEGVKMPWQSDDSSKKVVEVGAGWGCLSNEVAAAGAASKNAVEAWELDPESVDFINRRGKHLGVKAHVGAFEADESVPDESVDLVMSSMMLEHVRVPRDALTRWRKKLRPGGMIFIEVPNENPVPNWWGANPEKPYWVGHLYFWTPALLKQMLESLGFNVLKIELFEHPHANYSIGVGKVYELPEDTAVDATPSSDPHAAIIRVLAQKK